MALESGSLVFANVPKSYPKKWGICVHLFANVLKMGTFAMGTFAAPYCISFILGLSFRVNTTLARVKTDWFTLTRVEIGCLALARVEIHVCHILGSYLGSHTKTESLERVTV